VRVDHRRRHVTVSEELLHGADVLYALEQVRGKGIPNVWQVTRFAIPASIAAWRWCLRSGIRDGRRVRRNGDGVIEKIPVRFATISA
jgi:hypothetical protein